MLDGQSVVRTTDSNSSTVTYLNGPRGPEYERSGNNAPKWNLYDGLGSVVGTVNANGTILSKRKFDVYGANRGLTGESGTKHRFVGGLGHPSEDETGLVYMRARWMDPVTGRFTNEDAARDGHNWFEYCNSSPINLSDYTGCSPYDPISWATLYAIMFHMAFTGETVQQFANELRAIADDFDRRAGILARAANVQTALAAQADAQGDRARAALIRNSAKESIARSAAYRLAAVQLRCLAIMLETDHWWGAG